MQVYIASTLKMKQILKPNAIYIHESICILETILTKICT